MRLPLGLGFGLVPGPLTNKEGARESVHDTPPQVAGAYVGHGKSWARRPVRAPYGGVRTAAPQNAKGLRHRCGSATTAAAPAQPRRVPAAGAAQGERSHTCRTRAL